MKNLIIFSMVMLVMGSGYMFGTKLAPDTGLSKIPALDNDESSYLNAHGSGNARDSGLEGCYNALNSFYNNFEDIEEPFSQYFNDPLSKNTQISSDQLYNQAGLISSDDAKKIAQRFIEEPGAVTGSPLLQNMDSGPVYIVPVLLKGKNVGEIYIDAKTGKNVGGAGGVDYNETNKSGDNNSKVIDNHSNDEKCSVSSDSCKNDQNVCGCRQ